jgi:predicted TPR repeat methyltransferase
MTTSDSRQHALNEALAAHRAGRLTEAEVGYHRVLRGHPEDPRALYGLGLLAFHRGSPDSAIQYVQRSLVTAPANGRAWNTLGSMFMSCGRPEEAEQAYRRATEVAPDMSEALYNLGICLRNAGAVEEALVKLRAATTCAQPFPLAFEALGSLLYQLERVSEAAQVFLAWSVHDPQNASARYMGSAASGERVPPRAPDSYVREHFDSAAATFDSNLEALEYRAPQRVANALAAALAPAGSPGAAHPLNALLDIGCGTGLCGPHVRPLCRRLVGVDLSAKMIALARSRECYDELVTAELGTFMRAHPAAFEAAICADTLVYFGGLEQPLQAAHQALCAPGVLVFTLEAQLDDPSRDYRLQLHGRYCHSEAYIRRCLDSCGFELTSLTVETLRRERAEPVPGLLVVARRR